MNYNLPRILFAFGLGIIVGALMTELAYLSLKKENREPTVIELIIPAGTAQLMRDGKNPEILSRDMRFVVGDTLKVINNDNENHQLGPLYIPANSSASLKLSTEENLIVECSFESTKYVGLTIQEPVTWYTRLRGYFFSGFPLGTIFAVYSGLIVSKKKKQNESAS
ncbi:MAG: hypothetical protein JNM46_01735 [Anaerolineales bacterium]|nr:hypothetical protein [Anaerolineales bacterium]